MPHNPRLQGKRMHGSNAFVVFLNEHERFILDVIEKKTKKEYPILSVIRKTYA